MKPQIRCATMPDGNIEAAFMRDGWSGPIVRLVIETRLGNVVEATVEPGSDEFRWLVTEARKHVQP